MNDTTSPLATLDEQLSAAWAHHLASSITARRIESGQFDARLYAIYLCETFHYTAHNARNQALVGVHAQADAEYLRFCFRHALEETGHELMALHDVKKLGVLADDAVLPTPLPETEALIAYLYRVSSVGDPLGRLGYSFWAEDAYRHFAPLFAIASKTLALTAATTTFLSAHASIDVEHSATVRALIAERAKSQAQIDRISEVMLTSLDLTMRLFDAVEREYERLIRGRPTRYQRVFQ